MYYSGPSCGVVSLSWRMTTWNMTHDYALPPPFLSFNSISFLCSMSFLLSHFLLVCLTWIGFLTFAIEFVVATMSCWLLTVYYSPMEMYVRVTPTHWVDSVLRTRVILLFSGGALEALLWFLSSHSYRIYFSSPLYLLTNRECKWFYSSSVSLTSYLDLRKMTEYHTGFTLCFLVCFFSGETEQEPTLLGRCEHSWWYLSHFTSNSSIIYMVIRHRRSSHLAIKQHTGA